MSDVTTRTPQVPALRNLRDVGGRPAQAGARVARGRVYRSELLAYPGAPEMCGIWDPGRRDMFAALGLRTVLDLRTPTEAQRVASAWQEATGAQVVAVPIAEGGDGSRTNILELVLRREVPPLTPDSFADFYAQMLDRRAADFATGLRVLADAHRLPALVHCSAGKDRTGMFVALLLTVLGVPREVVVDDYAHTEIARPDRVLHYADRITGAGLGLDDVRVMFGSPARVMERSLDHLDRAYGGVPAYLTGPGGMTDDELARIRANLLTRGRRHR